MNDFVVFVLEAVFYQVVVEGGGTQDALLLVAHSFFCCFKQTWKPGTRRSEPYTSKQQTTKNMQQTHTHTHTHTIARSSRSCDNVTHERARERAQVSANHPRRIYNGCTERPQSRFSKLHATKRMALAWTKCWLDASEVDATRKTVVQPARVQQPSRWTAGIRIQENRTPAKKAYPGTTARTQTTIQDGCLMGNGPYTYNACHSRALGLRCPM